MASRISAHLMHRRWQAEVMAEFRRALQSAEVGASAELLALIGRFESCMKRILYRPIWTEHLGHTRLLRQTPLDRELRQKADKRCKREQRVGKNQKPTL